MYMFLSFMFFAFFIIFTIRYLYEIYVYIFNRENFYKKIKTKIFSAEFGGKEVSIKNRIYFTYPFIIVVLLFFSLAFFYKI
jgi:hypothetical protein